MTGAMYSAISGLKAHMNKLNVIGNNVANANTYGYKSARVTFQESLYNSVRSGSNGSVTMGGVNPSQLGYGCSVGTIDLDMGTQSYVPTGRALDCMISGDGFFMVGSKPDAKITSGKITLDKTDAQDLLLTRVGNFTFDPQGYLVDGQGNTVYGFVTCAGTTQTSGVTDKATAPGIAHKDSPALSTQLVPIRLPLYAKQVGTAGAAGYIAEGTAIFPGVDGTSGLNVYDDGTGTISTGECITMESINIDGNTGKITGINKKDKSILVIGYIPLANVANPNGVTHIAGPYYQAMEGAGDCEAAAIGDVLKGQKLNNSKVATDKDISGTGETVVISGGLESSGTDIATEFSEMITTQRGYQANTRIVTVTDSMLEELVNMKR